MAQPKKPSKKQPAPKRNATSKPAARTKPSPKPRKPAAASRKPSSKPRKPAVLAPEQRRSLLRARTDYPELVEQIERAWDANPRLRVEGLTKAKLRALLRKAETTSSKEAALAEKQRAKLRPLSDARMLAEDALWRGVLDVHRAAKFHGERDAALADSFAFLGDAFTKKTDG